MPPSSIEGWDQTPALMGLALYVGLTSLPLGVQGIEFQVQVMVGRFTGVDGAAGRIAEGIHGRASLAFLEPLPGLSSLAALSRAAVAPARSGAILRPKKRGPFQLVPVMVWAMAVRLE